MEKKTAELIDKNLDEALKMTDEENEKTHAFSMRAKSQTGGSHVQLPRN